MHDLTGEIYQIGEFTVDARARELSKGGDLLQLKPKVFDTLVYLVRNPGRTISKDELMKEIWPDTAVEENNLSQNISALRRLLGEKPGEHRFIDTVAGRGFRFVGEVKPVEPQISGEAVENHLLPTLTDVEETPHAPKTRKRGNGIYLAAFAAMLLIAGLAYLISYLYKQPAAYSVRTMAVLPFKPIAAENRNPALELGMADTLIWKLSGGALVLTPLCAVRRFDSLEQDPVAAGRTLGVDVVLDGSLKTVGDRIRISTRLIRVSDGMQLWADQFDEKFENIFAVQDSISAKVASALKVTLGVNEKKRYTANTAAYQLYLKGRFLSQKARANDIRTSIDYFEQALDLDPNYAPAYVGLADSYRALVLIADAPPNETLTRAKLAANRAIEIDNAYAEAHAILGWLTFWYDWDWDLSEKQLGKAIALDPGSSDARQFYAHLLSNLGRHNEALAEIDKALAVEPLSLRANTFKGIFLFQAGQYDEATVQFRKALDLDSDYRLALMFAGRTLIELQKYDEAVAMVRKARGSSIDNTDAIATEVIALARSGSPDKARETVALMQDRRKTEYVSPYNIASIFNALGETESALKFLEIAYTEKDVRMVFLKVEPKWNNLRTNPRFAALMKQMKFN